MPTYDYHCRENSQTVTVQHSMKECLTNWGEVCSKAELPLGETPAETPVERLISGGLLTIFGSSGTSSSSCEMPPMRSHGPCCGHPGSCRH